jgi:hypothetical protein
MVSTMGSTMGSWSQPWGHGRVVEVGPQWGRFQHSRNFTPFSEIHKNDKLQSTDCIKMEIIIYSVNIVNGVLFKLYIGALPHVHSIVKDGYYRSVPKLHTCYCTINLYQGEYRHACAPLHTHSLNF